MAPDSLNGEAVLTIDGVDHVVSLPFSRIRALKRDKGINLMSGGVDLADPDVLASVFAAALGKDEAEADLLLDKAPLKKVTEAIAQAMAQTVGVTKDDLMQGAGGPQ